MYFSSFMSERTCSISVVFIMWFLNKTNLSTSYENLLDTGHLNHPFEVWWEDSVLDKPARQLVPLGRVAAIDREARLGILVLGILKVTGYFLGQIRSQADGLWRKYVGGNPCEFHLSEEPDFNNGGKIFSVDVVFCLQVEVTQLTGSHGVVLGIEFIKTLEGLSTLQVQVKGNERRDCKHDS